MGRIAASSQHRGPQAPIFQRAASADLPGALVQPLAVFAASRQTFDVLIRSDGNRAGALTRIWAALPMAENGWDIDRMTVERAGTRFGWPVWRVSRGP